MSGASKEMVSTGVAAARLGCCRGTVVRMLREGRLRGIRLSRFFRVEVASLENLVVHKGDGDPARSER